MRLIRRTIYTIKTEGLLSFINKLFLHLHKYIKEIRFIFMKNKIKKEIDEIFMESKYSFIDLFIHRCGWNMDLFQRPQHISLNISNMGGLILFASNSAIDKNIEIKKKIKDNLYLINLENKYVFKYIKRRLKNIDKLKICHTYCVDTVNNLKTLKKYEKMGFKILYEYIDEISEDICCIRVSQEHFKKHNYILNNTNYFVVASADKLEEEVKMIRGDKNYIFACNGVDYEHWQKAFTLKEIPNDMQEIVDLGNPIIGYYGALASWFDYELVKNFAKERPNYEFVIIGVPYDKSYENAELYKRTNIHFLGPKDYQILNQYVYWFDVCTIPFRINDITESTSPIKLFEYMAANKPIVTTDMLECRKYKSVLIATGCKDYIYKIDNALDLKDNLEYLEILKKEAKDNTWKEKTKDILSLILQNDV